MIRNNSNNIWSYLFFKELMPLQFIDYICCIICSSHAWWPWIDNPVIMFKNTGKQKQMSLDSYYNNKMGTTLLEASWKWESWENDGQYSFSAYMVPGATADLWNSVIGRSFCRRLHKRLPKGILHHAVKRLREHPYMLPKKVCKSR